MCRGSRAYRRRVASIEAAHRAGMQGIGVYNNAIHLDLGFKLWQASLGAEPRQGDSIAVRGRVPR